MLCSNIKRNSDSLARYGDTEGPDYAAQITHIAGHSARSCTPGAAFLSLAVG